MTVSEQIIQVIDTLCEKFGIAIDWTGANVIPYIEMLCGKLITYEIVTSIAWMVIMALLSITSIVATKKLYPIFKEGIENQGHWDEDWSIGAGFAIAGLILINVVTIIVWGAQIMDIIKCVTFPEMYVFEYVSALVSGT
jgi:hypothetical protein